MATFRPLGPALPISTHFTNVPGSGLTPASRMTQQKRNEDKGNLWGAENKVRRSLRGVFQGPGQNITNLQSVGLQGGRGKFCADPSQQAEPRCRSGLRSRKWKRSVPTVPLRC
jgi:hypothetical protein